MRKRSSKPGKRQDVNELAKSLVDQLTGQAPPPGQAAPVDDGKNPAAVELGRLGGLKGGKARAEKLSAKKRKEIAKMAAKARWSNKKE